MGVRVFLQPRVVLVAATLAAAAASAVVGAQQAQTPPALPNFDAVTVRSFRVQDNVYMLAGAGGNVTVQIGNDGVLVVDTQFAQMADKLLAEIARLSGNKPIRYVIDTHVHPDHVGGNERFRRAGRAIVAGNVAGDVRGNEGATLIAHETVAARMSQQDGATPPAAAGALPTDTFFGERDEVFFNGEAVRLIHQPAAHTDGDVLVFFRKSDVIATGDVYVNTSYPVIDMARGGTINGIIAGLNRIIDITVPRDKQEGGTMVIPGHGRIADEADVVEYLDLVTIIRDRFQDAIKKKMTLEQIKAAKLVRDYEGRYGATQGVWTTDAFLEAAYKSLSTPAATSSRTR